MRQFLTDIAPALTLHEAFRALVIVACIAVFAAAAKFGMGL